MVPTELPLAGDGPVVLTVADLTRQIRELLEGAIGEVWVAGEISNFRAPGSGHLYFTLKDSEATLSAVMFRGDASRLRVKLADGLAIVARGRITVYEARGQYQIQVLEARAQGQGTLQQKFEALKRKLAAEGLFESERKRELPIFPERIGVVTALQGAVLQDFLNILRRRAPGIHVMVRGTRVQGTGAAEEIAAAIAAFNESGDVDVLVVARGGGSLEDLWAFNEEVVARALAGSSIPTVSAVGHETDFTIADFVADVRAPTPSVAAELVSRDWADWREDLAERRGRLEREMKLALERLRQRWTRARDSYVFREPKKVVQQMQQRVDDLQGALSNALRGGIAEAKHRRDKLFLRWSAADPRLALRRKREQLILQEAKLRAFSPEATLKRGYALVLDEKGALVRAATKELVGKQAHVRLGEGELGVKILTSKP